MKKAGVIAAVSLFVVVLILVAVRNSSGSGKEGGTVVVSPSNVTNTRGYDVGMYKIKDSSLLDYTQPIIQTKGTVYSKSCYLDGTQVVYLITINLDELNSSTIKYYCSYQVYKSVDEGTRVLVSYQKLTESAFSVYSVSAE